MNEFPSLSVMPWLDRSTGKRNRCPGNAGPPLRTVSQILPDENVGKVYPKNCDRAKDPECYSYVTYPGLMHICQLNLCNELPLLNIPAYRFPEFNSTGNETMACYLGPDSCNVEKTQSSTRKRKTTHTPSTSTSTTEGNTPVTTKAATFTVTSEVILSATSTAICSYLQCWTYFAGLIQTLPQNHRRSTAFL
ncbi:hypothetical protein RvY_06998 [Ramazzottius varieornatus]|uniref:Uncharacterized protein n=1 Tax=Ramazzottius varieornatus TaxID=947166 RepID=A0A1D1V0I8_RAMVA|nr:hypothetical protein RvY_06998 [Ramazzottius varieornatus]